MQVSKVQTQAVPDGVTKRQASILEDLSSASKSSRRGLIAGTVSGVAGGCMCGICGGSAALAAAPGDWGYSTLPWQLL